MLLILIVSVIGYSVEGFSKLSKNWISGSSTCRQRKNCSSCLNNGYDSTGGLCYWCKSSGCINPDKNDAKYFNSCSTDKNCKT